MLRTRATIAVGKAARAAARLRGGGSALPGLVVERLDPGFLTRMLADLPGGVVVVSGTNGKTTTTKMLVAVLRAHGRRVFTNPTGSNFTRGVISSMLGVLPAENTSELPDEKKAGPKTPSKAPAKTPVKRVRKPVAKPEAKE